MRAGNNMLDMADLLVCRWSNKEAESKFYNTSRRFISPVEIKCWNFQKFYIN